MRKDTPLNSPASAKYTYGLGVIGNPERSGYWLQESQ